MFPMTLSFGITFQKISQHLQSAKMHTNITSHRNHIQTTTLACVHVSCHGNNNDTYMQMLHIMSEETLAHVISTHVLSSPTEATVLPRSIHHPRVGRSHRVGGRSEGGMREWVGLAHILKVSEVDVPHLSSSADTMETS